jgi:O-antigen biosynthesis protein WbqP
MLLHSPHNIATSELENADQYITRAGKFLRKTSIDELPQLINVIKGDMSIVGPRPLIINERYIHSMRYQQGVYFLRPGLAGLAQVNGRDLVDPEEKIRLDAEYLHTFSFKTDIKILLKTIQVVFTHSGYVEGKQSQVNL